MLREPRRLIAAVIAIAAGVAFVAATLVLSSSLQASVDRGFAGETYGSAVIVQPTFNQTTGEETLISEQAVADIRKVDGVTKVRTTVLSFFIQKTSSGEQYVQGMAVPELTSTTTLKEGRLPAARNEVAVSSFLATNRKVTVGQKLDLVNPMTEEAQTIQVTVVGVIEPGPEVTGGPSPLLFASTADLFTWRGQPGYDMAYVESSQPQTQVRDAIRALPSVKSAGWKVQTTDDYVKEQRETMAEMVRAITGFLLAFGVISLVVSALVIANTFSILVAQRTRTLALLRCVGATKGQVFRTVVGEAVLMGLIGGVLGVVGGIGLAFGLYLLSKANNVGLTDFVISPLAVVVPIALGLAVTLLASVLPARRATRVMPLAALRPNLAPATGTRAGRAVLAMGAVLTVAGAGALLFGALKPGRKDDFDPTFLVVGIAGGVLSFLGVMMLGTVVIPALARLVGVIPATLGGVPGKLAVANSRRNPSRAAATCSALLIGVTLITTVAVGAQSGQATAQQAFDKLFPADLTLSTRSSTVPEALLTKVRNDKVVAKAERADSAPMTVGGNQLMVTGVPTSMRDVLRYQPYLGGLTDTTVLVPTSVKGIANGASVTVTGDKGSRTLTAVVSADGPGAPVVTKATFDQLTGESQQGMWVRLKDDVKPSEAAEHLSQELANDAVSIQGGALMREQLEQTLLIVVGVISALLAVSVLIALVGITNTLGLSVLERTQESGLLRALGLTAGRLRGMFAIEAVILAVVAVLLGLGLGLAYGIAGAYALLAGEVSVVIDIPWLPVIGIAAAAVVAGLVASIVPAIRAGRIKPAAALAVGE